MSYNNFDHLQPAPDDGKMKPIQHLNLSDQKFQGESAEKLLPSYIPIKKEISPYFKNKKPLNNIKGLK
jgi:hypothetical protein